MKTAGCICHTANLLQKDKIQSSTIQSILNFAQCLSRFLYKKPKVKSILYQCENLSNLSRIQDHFPTRFFVTFSWRDMQSVSSHKKDNSDVKLSAAHQMWYIRLFSCSLGSVSDSHHNVSIFAFTKTIQSGYLTFYECLLTLLELTTKLLARLGHSIELSPRSYLTKWFIGSTIWTEPLLKNFTKFRFKEDKTALEYSIHVFEEQSVCDHCIG